MIIIRRPPPLRGCRQDFDSYYRAPPPRDDYWKPPPSFYSIYYKLAPCPLTRSTANRQLDAVGAMIVVDLGEPLGGIHAC